MWCGVDLCLKCATKGVDGFRYKLIPTCSSDGVTNQCFSSSFDGLRFSRDSRISCSIRSFVSSGGGAPPNASRACAKRAGFVCDSDSSSERSSPPPSPPPPLPLPPPRPPRPPPPRPPPPRSASHDHTTPTNYITDCAQSRLNGLMIRTAMSESFVTSTATATATATTASTAAAAPAAKPTATTAAATALKLTLHTSIRHSTPQQRPEDSSV